MKVYDALDESLTSFIEGQHLFFVATAPLTRDGHVNLSPKGLDSFQVLDPARVAYVDLGGSGAETHAHLRENGRICLMFCAFEGEPLILRLYGTGRSHLVESEKFAALRGGFEGIDVPVRAIVEVDLHRVQTSCGWGVPEFDYRGERSRLTTYVAKFSQDEYIARRRESNARSIDGLPALEGE